MAARAIAGLQGLLDGDVRSAARAITQIEHNDPDIVPLLKALYRAGGHSRIVGITGPPGAGKSTLVGRLLSVWRRQGKRVAVLAIDPSSPFSGGAVLGDRLRMAEHGCDDGVFIRSMASRGQLGGLSKTTGDALTVLDAMSWDTIIVETVGVGQNETDIMRHAAVVVLVQTPMGGDDVQAAKAGITEIGDIFVVNKADHPGADDTVRHLNDMIRLVLCLHADRTWHPPVVKTDAAGDHGIEALATQIDRCFTHLRDHPDTAVRLRREQAKHRVGEILRDLLDRRMRNSGDKWLEALIEPIVERRSDPYTAAGDLLARMTE